MRGDLEPAGIEVGQVRTGKPCPPSPQLGFARGQRWEVRAHLRELERRGDLEVLWEQARDLGADHCVPYVRLRTLEQVRRRLVLRIGGLVIIGGGAFASFLAAVWDARQALALIAAGAFLLAGSVVFLVNVIGRALGIIRD